MVADNVTNLGDILNKNVQRNPALTDCRDWNNPKTYTHGALDSGANNCASGLRARGLEPGDAVAILSANRAEFMIAFMGILRAGLIAVPINHKFSHEVIRFIFNDADVKLTICDAERAETLGSNSPVVNFDSSGEESFNNLLQPGILETFETSEHAIAMILYTSGSTGPTKGCSLNPQWPFVGTSRKGR